MIAATVEMKNMTAVTPCDPAGCYVMRRPTQSQSPSMYSLQVAADNRYVNGLSACMGIMTNDKEIADRRASARRDSRRPYQSQPH